MGFLKQIQYIADIIEKILKISIIISLGAIAVLINVSVFFRYVLSSPLSWGNELSSFLLVFTVLFSSAIALRHNMFVNVQIIRDNLSEKLRKSIVTITNIIIAIFLFICILSPAEMIERALTTNTISPAMGLPMHLVYRIVQFGFTGMLLFLVFGMIDTKLKELEHSEQ